MILEFIDNTKIIVEAIFGEPTIYDAVERDTLRIEVDPSKYTIQQIEEVFKKKYNCLKLASYEKEDNTDSGRYIIGEGYGILGSIEFINREKKAPNSVGFIRKKITEDVIVVTLYQHTYDEWINLLKNLQNSSDPGEVDLWHSLQG